MIYTHIFSATVCQNENRHLSHSFYQCKASVLLSDLGDCLLFLYLICSCSWSISFGFVLLGLWNVLFDSVKVKSFSELDSLWSLNAFVTVWVFYMSLINELGFINRQGHVIVFYLLLLLFFGFSLLFCFIDACLFLLLGLSWANFNDKWCVSNLARIKKKKKKKVILPVLYTCNFFEYCGKCGGKKYTTLHF